MNIPRKFKTALQILEKYGWNGFISKLRSIRFEINEKLLYQKWITEFDNLTETDYYLIKKRIEELNHQPLISILLPVYNVDEKWLRLCLDSVCRQIYQKWELCIADDCSTKPHIKKVLQEYQNKDSRIKIVFREQNGHISAASNSALEIATGEFCVLLDHDDELSEHAIYFIAEELNRFPATQMIYSDEDLIDEKGNRSNPKFKPDWSQDLLYSYNFITHLSAYKTDLLRQIGGFRLGTEGSQDYDLALRVCEKVSSEQIRHIPHILYHWRIIPGSVAFSINEKSYAVERARKAISRHFQRIGTNATVKEGFENLHQVIYQTEPVFEIFQQDNATAESLNNIVCNSLADILIFVDESISINSKNQLANLAKIASQQQIGAVGAKIIDQNLLIKNSGILLGINDLIGFAHRGLSKTVGGNCVRAQVIGNYSAVAGVLAIRRELFKEIGEFDSRKFNLGLFEIDLCLRLREKGLRIVFDPTTELIQKKVSRLEKFLLNNDLAEVTNFREKWFEYLKKDEFYNENLSLENEKFALSIPPRVKKPWQN